MTSDAGAFEPRPRGPDFRLPDLVSVKASRTSYRPERRTVPSALPTLPSTVELQVETSGPIPVRARGPVLHVGETTLTEVTADDATHYRFVALRPGDLQPGAPVSLAWSGDRPARSDDSPHRYHPPED